MNVPVEALPVAMTESVDVAELPEGGVMGEGRLTVTPVGAVPTHDVVSVTAELKPLIEVTVTIELPLDPWLIERADGDDVIEKSGTAAARVVKLTALPTDGPALFCARIMY